jgi:hypothetical protein
LHMEGQYINTFYSTGHTAETASVYVYS